MSKALELSKNSVDCHEKQESHSYTAERSFGSKTGDYVCVSCGDAIWVTDYKKYTGYRGV